MGKNTIGAVAGARVLVTGAAGFVGSNLVRRLLSEGADVYALVRPRSDFWRLDDIATQIHWLECDLLDAPAVGECVSAVRPAMLYHTAFPGGHSADPHTDMNMLSTGLLGTYALLSAALENKVERFFHIGSSTEYGPSHQLHRESDRLDPVDMRGVGKAASTLLCRQYARQQKIKVVILRLFSVFGPWEQAHRFIPVICRAILQDHALSLTPPGLMHDWIFVEDVMDACLNAASCQVSDGEIINIGSGEQHSNEEIVQALEEIANRKIKIEPGAREPGSIDTTHWVADISLARDLLGWQPCHSLRSGLEAAYQFWRDRASRQV